MANGASACASCRVVYAKFARDVTEEVLSQEMGEMGWGQVTEGERGSGTFRI